MLYSSLDSLYRSPLAARFREIEQTFDVGIVYGRRQYVDKETGVISTPEVLLIDVARYDEEKIGGFKFQLCGKRSASRAASTNTSGTTSNTCAWPSRPSPRCMRWGRPRPSSRA